MHREIYDEWMDGQSNRVDSRSEELTLGFNDSDYRLSAHSISDEINPSSDAWLDNGSFAVRQPHTSTQQRHGLLIKCVSLVLISWHRGKVLF